MKKYYLIIWLSVLFCMTGRAVNAQDTVRYGDPWYAFNPLPNVTSDLPRSGVAPAPWMMGSDYTDYRMYYGYENHNYTIYGIAVVMDSLPGPEWHLMPTLLRGIQYQRDPYQYYFVYVDSLYQEDTIKTWLNPVTKRCNFEYFYEYDDATGNHKSSVTKNCYEFYFDSPIKTDSLGASRFADTFFVGEDYCRNMGTVSPSELYPFCPNVLKTFNVFAMPTFHYCPGRDHSFYTTSQTYLTGNEAMCWGGIFPIVGLRCCVPRGLTLSADSLAVFWPADGDAQSYEIAVCTDTVSPDNGLILATDSTSIALSPFNPDSTYRIYFRKECGFGGYSAWSDWSAPLVIEATNHTSVNPVTPPDLLFAVSPNPTDGTVTIRHQATEGTLTLTDLQGRQLLSAPASQHTLDLSHLPQGTYLLTLSTPSGSATKQVIKE